jgi:hypothetical protein
VPARQKGIVSMGSLFRNLAERGLRSCPTRGRPLGHHLLSIRSLATACAGILLAAGPALAQVTDLSWNTMDCGGGTSSGGAFTVSGTIGQPDAGDLSGGGFALAGGFWGGVGSISLCYPNCDASTAAPVLNIADFACFLNKFAAGDSYANCDGSTASPVLNIADFACFLNQFAAGCP